MIIWTKGQNILGQCFSTGVPGASLKSTAIVSFVYLETLRNTVNPMCTCLLFVVKRWLSTQGLLYTLELIFLLWLGQQFFTVLSVPFVKKKLRTPVLLLCTFKLKTCSQESTERKGRKTFWPQFIANLFYFFSKINLIYH